MRATREGERVLQVVDRSGGNPASLVIFTRTCRRTSGLRHEDSVWDRCHFFKL